MNARFFVASRLLLHVSILWNCVAFERTSAPQYVETVKQFNLSAFSGHWFQTHTSQTPNQTIERDAFCVVANYTQQMDASAPNDVFRIVHSQNIGGPTGTIRQAKGTAVSTHPLTHPGKFLLQYDSRPFINSFYWIVALGELSPPSNYQYPWAVVSNPLGSMLFVLARNVTEFSEKYERRVMSELKRRGLLSGDETKLARTFQSQVECRYPAPIDGVVNDRVSSREMLYGFYHESIDELDDDSTSLGGQTMEDDDCSKLSHFPVRNVFIDDVASGDDSLPVPAGMDEGIPVASATSDEPYHTAGIVCIIHRDGTESCRDTADTPTGR